jgi:hypothetical protein
MPKKRPTDKRKPNKRILILCEGKETEPNYFKGLKHDQLNQRKLAALRIEIYDSRKNTGKELIAEAKHLKKEAKEEKNPYDDVWVVIDRDGYTKHPQTFDQARANKINIALSSISFEFWFLLHFEYTTKGFGKADDLIDYLKKYMKDYNKSGDNYHVLKNMTKNAIDYAQRIRTHWEFEIERGKKIYDLNPYTDVDVLVDKLLNL